MKTFLLVAVVSGFFCISPAYAQEQSAGNLDDFCRTITVHVPNPDVAFQPGYDAKGNKVVPADIAPPAIVLPETYHFTLNSDQMAVLSQNGVEFSQPVVDITVSGNQILFNGVPYEGGDTQNLRILCLQE